MGGGSRRISGDVSGCLLSSHERQHKRPCMHISTSLLANVKPKKEYARCVQSVGKLPRSSPVWAAPVCRGMIPLESKRPSRETDQSQNQLHRPHILATATSSLPSPRHTKSLIVLKLTIPEALPGHLIYNLARLHHAVVHAYQADLGKARLRLHDRLNYRETAGIHSQNNIFLIYGKAGRISRTRNKRAGVWTMGGSMNWTTASTGLVN
jgi:hypothetical protein